MDFLSVHSGLFTDLRQIMPLIFFLGTSSEIVKELNSVRWHSHFTISLLCGNQLLCVVQSSVSLSWMSPGRWEAPGRGLERHKHICC